MLNDSTPHMAGMLVLVALLILIGLRRGFRGVSLSVS